MDYKLEEITDGIAAILKISDKVTDKTKAKLLKIIELSTKKAMGVNCKDALTLESFKSALKHHDKKKLPAVIIPAEKASHEDFDNSYSELSETTRKHSTAFAHQNTSKIIMNNHFRKNSMEDPLLVEQFNKFNKTAVELQIEAKKSSEKFMDTTLAFLGN